MGGRGRGRRQGLKSDTKGHECGKQNELDYGGKLDDAEMRREAAAVMRGGDDRTCADTHDSAIAIIIIPQMRCQVHASQMKRQKRRGVHVTSYAGQSRHSTSEQHAL